MFFYVQIIENNLKQDYVEKHDALDGNKIKKNCLSIKVKVTVMNVGSFERVSLFEYWYEVSISNGSKL